MLSEDLCKEPTQILEKGPLEKHAVDHRLEELDFNEEMKSNPCQGLEFDTEKKTIKGIENFLNLSFKYDMENDSFQETCREDTDEVKELVDHIETAMQSTSQNSKLVKMSPERADKMKHNFDIIEKTVQWDEDIDNFSLIHENQSFLRDESTDGEQDTLDSGNGENSFLGEEDSFADLMFSKQQKSSKKLKK